METEGPMEAALNWFIVTCYTLSAIFVYRDAKRIKPPAWLSVRALTFWAFFLPLITVPLWIVYRNDQLGRKDLEWLGGVVMLYMIYVVPLGVIAILGGPILLQFVVAVFIVLVIPITIIYMVLKFH
ncbi:hypothetical protein HY346_03135 [Candidatus Microgenomates bacterium]|nr:hypothetical protein [Candidatus Microgenomates bacterium]